MNRLLLVGTLLVAVLVGLGVLLWKPPTPAAKAPQFDLRDVPRLGAEQAPVTVVVIEDFKCPVCKLLEEQLEAELKDRYVNSGKVKVYTLIWPFLGKKFGLTPDDSVLAAQAGQCVFREGGHEAFQSFKTYLFRAQSQENRVWATPERLTELAGNVEGLKLAQFTECLSSNATLTQVQQNTAQAQKNGLTGTPALFVNGVAVQGRTFAELKTNLFRALDEAVRP